MFELQILLFLLLIIILNNIILVSKSITSNTKESCYLEVKFCLMDAIIGLKWQQAPGDRTLACKRKPSLYS